MRRFLSLLAVFALTVLVAAPATAADPSAFKAGLAVQVITPEEPIWMAGYGGRNKPAEGKVQDLYVKVLALEDPAGKRLVLLTSDLLGLPRELADAVAADVMKQTGLPRERLMLTASHTHCGPVLGSSLLDMYDMPGEQVPKIEAYTRKLQGRMVETVLAALKDLHPACLAIGKGTARFAINRRQMTDKGVIIGLNPEGPVDHDVPVLRVETPEGKLRAVVFGYACHNTTLDFYQWCGDYAGYAQEDLEKAHPGAVALFWIGCAGDANPNPRRTLDLAKRHGKELADAVEGVLSGSMTPVKGTTAARYETISLPFDTLPTREQLVADKLSKQGAVRRRAERLLKVLDKEGKIEDHYPYYPVQAWRLGDGLLWVALGGEVVVDYDLRLKKELAGDRPLWITAYANNVMCYIASARVLKEGGYEADQSMVFYGMPTRWSPAVEEKIIAKVHDVVKAVK